MTARPSTRLIKAAEMVGREKQQHKWTRLPMIGETVCEHCGQVRAGWNENTRCIPIYPRPDIEAMKSIERKHNGN